MPPKNWTLEGKNRKLGWIENRRTSFMDPIRRRKIKPTS